MLLPFLIFTSIAALIYYIYQYGTKNENFFLEKGIKFQKPTFLFGNCFDMVRNKIGFFDYMRYIGEKFPNEKIIGHFDFRSPLFVILDPEIVKYLAVKEFDNFCDHRSVFDEKQDPLFGNSIFSLRGQKWRDMRATLSPAFTGSKMRQMCDLIVEICDQIVDFMKKEAEEKGPQTYEMKEFFSKFGNDIIGTCAFGVKVNSFTNKENDFYACASRLFNFTSFKVQLKLILFRLCPKIMELFKIPLFEENDRNFLKNLVLDTMKVREEKKIIRPDMIHLLMEAQKGNLTHNDNDMDTAGFATVEESEIGLVKSKRKWSDDELVAQCFLFFLAGFDTSSTVLSFLFYEIVANPDVQEKLYEEISEVHANLEGKPLKYETLPKLKYLDMVISEALRKWPVQAVDRVCIRDFTFKYDGDKEFTFHKGDAFWVPILAYHYNPEYFPDPDKFDPERFNDENKEKINTSTYLPFGVGPRNCIGSRLGLMNLKAIVFYIVLNFHLEATEKTQIPIQLAKNLLGLQPEKGIHILFRPRNQKKLD
ncbi:probable cytochrome P450 9f2 [Lutzomyia longipalpis]|uniref:probable cytochrome P450 9f2 n=1 Tax=Lutzomyia longipalpis TaxID=7200 RepID=UPI002483302D|nr:probable cytochrome P450 9f2 [Lutzomyia longipalpis]